MRYSHGVNEKVRGWIFRQLVHYDGLIIFTPLIIIVMILRCIFSGTYHTLKIN